MTHYQLKTASKTIAVSEATKKDLIKKVGISGKKINVVYEGVDRSVFSSQSSAVSLIYKNRVLIQYGLKKNRYFLFVGTVQPRKNLERLIRAFDRFLTMDDRGSKMGVEGRKLYKLIVVGGKGWKSENIYRLPKELGIEDRVSFLGRVSDEELAALYSGATALTYPSLFEGFGLPIIEAFACSCPVITSNISSMPEVAGKAALLVDPYNIEAIFKAMRLLASNDLFRSSLIKKGILRSSYFDWKNTAVKTLEVILGK
jgi:glycosyltransferase involved in cell wall biosynthesis